MCVVVYMGVFFFYDYVRVWLCVRDALTAFDVVCGVCRYTCVRVGVCVVCFLCVCVFFFFLYASWCILCMCVMQFVWY